MDRPLGLPGDARRASNQRTFWLVFNLVVLIGALCISEARAGIKACEIPHPAGEWCDPGQEHWVEESAVVSGGWAIAVCTGTSLVDGDNVFACESSGGQWAFKLPGDLEESDLVHDEGYALRTVVGKPYFECEVGCEPTDPEDPEEHEIPWSSAGPPFSLAFMVYMTFWALGKGIGLLADFVRRA